MVEKLEEGYHVVCASRHVKGGGYYSFPFYRLLLSRGVNFILRHLFPIEGIRDYSIFFRAYRVGTIRQAITYYGDNFIIRKGFASNAEALIKLRRFNIKGAEVPLKYMYDLKKSESGMKIFKTVKEYLYLFIDNMKG
jgi:hypothetical protein